MTDDKKIYNELLTKKGMLLTLPSVRSYNPVPTETDYINGSIQRFFVYDRMENLWIEVDGLSYTNVKNNSTTIYGGRYTSVSLFWRITGPVNETVNQYGVYDVGVKKTNRNQVLKIDSEHPGFRNKFISYVQFWKAV